MLPFDPYHLQPLATLNQRRIISLPGVEPELVWQTGLPKKFISSLVQRADIARLPYVRRKTILPVGGAGYDSLAKIAGADLSKMEQDMEAYFQRTQGKSFVDYKSVILLQSMITWARALPEILLP